MYFPYFNKDGIRWLMRFVIRFLSSKIQSSLYFALYQNYISGDEFDSLHKDCNKIQYPISSCIRCVINSNDKTKKLF